MARMSWRPIIKKYRKFIGIDYSGAKQCHSPLSGIRVFVSGPGQEPTQARIDSHSGQHWSRRSLSHWLLEILANASEPFIVGIDHGFSFPDIYFEKYNLRRDWPSFLNDFVQHWPTTMDDTTVAQLLEINRKSEGGRVGQSTWRRLTEEKSRGAKSVFHFSVPGSVASSTHAGISWLHFLKNHPNLSNKLHFWPFDGWRPVPGKSVIAEVYPSLWRKAWVKTEKTQDEHDAYSIAKALSEEFSRDDFFRWFEPRLWQNISLKPDDVTKASYEGWILGLH